MAYFLPTFLSFTQTRGNSNPNPFYQHLFSLSYYLHMWPFLPKFWRENMKKKGHIQINFWPKFLSKLAVGIYCFLSVVGAGGCSYIQRGTMSNICRCIWMSGIWRHCHMGGLDTPNSVYPWSIKFITHWQWGKVRFCGVSMLIHLIVLLLGCVSPEFCHQHFC